MPIPIPQLDDKQFEALVNEARLLIPRHAPTWTDHNLHDPGITLIELFAWLAEMQIYTLDRVTDRHIEKFLRLLGFSPKPAAPARAPVSFSLPTGRTDPFRIPQGTRLIGQRIGTGTDIPFETARELQVVPSRLIKVERSDARGQIDLTEEYRRGPYLYPFGGELGAPIGVGSALGLGFDRPFPPVQVTFTLELYEADLAPVGEHGEELPEVIPSAAVQWEYLAVGDRWLPLPDLTEETRVIHRLHPGESDFQPLFGYIGPAFHLAFDHHGNLLLVANDGRLVRLQHLVSYPSHGSFWLRPLDSGAQNIHWHKLLLEGERPPETSLAIQFLIRGGGKPLTLEELEAVPDAEWSAPLTNFTDALLEGPPGRFLALRGRLATNNPLTTLGIRALTAVFPRRSYLRYLPPIYQDDPAGKAFFERFLSIFETLTGRLDAQIDETPILVDPAATPAEFLPWLSSWLAFGLDEGWSELQRREFLSEAMGQYRQRGTREGISRSVEWLIGKAPILVEPFQLGCIQDPALREEYERLYGTEGCHFCLLIDSQTAIKPETMAMIKRMVEEQVPAHVMSGVMELRPWFRLGMHTYLEINTQLTRPVIRLEESVLGGGETGLIEREEAGQVERKSRIGVDTSLT